MDNNFDSIELDSHEQANDRAVAPVNDDAIIPSGIGAAAQRELYGALMEGLGRQERDDLVHLMVDNIERLRSDGDSYAP